MIILCAWAEKMYDRLFINMRQKIKNICRKMLHHNYSKKELVEQASEGYITEAILKHILVNLPFKLLNSFNKNEYRECNQGLIGCL